MSFHSPWFLLLLVPLAGLAAAAVVLRRRRDRYAVRFAALPMLDRVVPERPAWRRHLTGCLALAALALLATAAARPEVDMRVPRERATVVVAIDTSVSMQAEDVEPNRMAAASDAAERFIDDLPDDVNVGLVGFAGSASVLARPTDDHDAVRAALGSLRMADRTAIGEAVFTSLDQVATMAGVAPDGADGAAQEGSVPARIVLLSDGSNTAGRPLSDAASAAVEAGVPVSTIAYGTPSGVVEGEDGQQVPVPVDAAALARLAETTGGTSYTAASGDELRDVYEDIGSSIGWRTEPRELAPYLAAAAFLFILTAAGLSLRWFARLV
jgi:Ca-activated chloride channel family protein